MNTWLRKGAFTVLILSVFGFIHIIYTGGGGDNFIQENFNFFRVLPYLSESDQKTPSLPPATFTATNWIVVTSISAPTEQIAKLASIPEWQLLVVADKKTPSDWFHPNAIILSTFLQSTLGYNTVNLLPWNSYTRKIIGYLYAIQHGAQVIYDTDDDNAPDDVAKFILNFPFKTKNDTVRGLIMTPDKDSSSLVKNPYAHFGQDTIWPRGYPLEEIGRPYNNTYRLCPTLPTPLIQQGLVNGDPDVDAIFRLTRKKMYKPLNVHFDEASPPVIYPAKLMAPFNSQNTVFLYNAFWALFLPTTVAFRVTDIWRGYWAQPLLWKVGGSLGFYSAHTLQIRNAHNYLKDFVEEDQLYKESGNLIKLLTEWKCPHDNLYSCMIHLSQLMADEGLWSWDEVKLVYAWIEDLKFIGYKEPRILEEYNISPCFDYQNTETVAIFAGLEENQGQTANPRYHLKNFCNFSTFSDSYGQSGTNNNSELVIFPSTLLVVTFNHPIYTNIWLLDILYRPHYPNILYCGEVPNASIINNLTSSEDFIKANVTKFTLIHASVLKGRFAYECAIKAIEMSYYQIEDYIVLSDDVLLNFWNTSKFDKEEMWTFNYFTDLNTNLPTNATATLQKWGWWRGKFGKNATIKALDHIYSSDNAEVITFRKSRANFGYNSTHAVKGMSDIFRFPSSKQEVFYQVATIMRQSQVFLEIAVPLLVSGLSSPEKIVNLTGVYTQYRGGDTLRYFDENQSIVHPVKLGQVVKNQKLIRSYCDKYVTHVLNT